MKRDRLAQWLQEHTEMLGQVDQTHPGAAFHLALYESIINAVLHDRTRMVDSVVESATAHALAQEQPLLELLNIPQNLRRRIWQRLTDEIDPDLSLVMLNTLDPIFTHITRTIIQNYQHAPPAETEEPAPPYQKPDQKVMDYAVEMARANRELAWLERVKTDFISIAAHELKTPLTLIQGYVDILLDIEADSRVNVLIEGISRGTERMHTIVENMLDLSALEMNRLSLTLTPINLKSMLEVLIGQLDRALQQRQQTICLEELEHLPAIEADNSRMHQVFKHIIINAIKYTPDGGQINISGQLLPADDQLPPCVQITVRDTGVGVAPEERHKIFEKFYRSGDSSLHSSGEIKFMGAGPGLGLAIVKGLIEAHGGEIWVESQGFDIHNHPGSPFIIKLPIKATPRPGVPVVHISPPK